MTDLSDRSKGVNSDFGQLHDPVLQTGGITINSDSYSSTLDRIYDVRGLTNIHIEIENAHATNGLIYKIEKARINYGVISELVDADFDQNILGNTTVESLVSATGTVTLASVTAADTVTINNIVYTAVSGTKSDNTEFDIDGTDTVDAVDLVDSVTNDTRQGTLADITADNVAGVVTFTSTAIGTAGNAVTLVSSNGTRLAVSAATLSGGVDNVDLNDIVDVSPETTAIRIRVRRETASNDSTLAGIVSVN